MAGKIIEESLAINNVGLDGYIRVVSGDGYSYRMPVQTFVELCTSAETIQDAIDAWIDEHPEAITTVQDGSITEVKLSADLQETLHTLIAAVGGPNAAATVAEMTDTSKVYVYTGSESGYTAGNWYYFSNGVWVSGGVYNSTALETDTTLSVAGMAADAKKTGDQITELKEDLSESYADSKIQINLTEGAYVDRNNGNIVSYGGYSYTQLIDVSGMPIMYITGITRGSSDNAFYDANENYISGFIVRIASEQPFVEIPANAKYARLSGQTASMSQMVIRKMTPCLSREYDVYIAGANSKYKNQADYVCSGNNDNRLINAIIRSPRIKKVYFYGDSTFSLTAPIVLKDDMEIKSNGAIFTQPAMVTTSVASAQTDLTAKLLRVNSVTGIESGQYLYLQNDDGNNMYNIVDFVSTGSYPSITFKNPVDYLWTPDNNAVVKTANPCFVLDHVSNVVLDGVCIDWNVEENPIQTYNPYFLQEGISVQYSKNITIKDCNIENGGRRGICTTDALDVHITNCFIRNWHEHGIDIFNGYASEGNTLENPMLNNCIMEGVICTENKMHGIQLHRGSGCIVDNCISYGNTDGGIGMAEYAHDNIVSNSFVYGNAIGVVIRTGSRRNNIDGNMIKDNTRGVYIRGTTSMRGLENRISNNLLSDITGDGILVENSDMTIINDNSLLNTSPDMATYKPILCASCTHSYILQNSIKQEERGDTTTYAIRCAGGSTNYNVVKGNIIHNANAPSATGANDVVEGNVVF